MMFLSLLSVQAFAAGSDPADDSQVAEAIMSRDTVVVKDARSVAGLPHRLLCNDGVTISGLNTLSPVFTDASPGYLTDAQGQHLLVIYQDGDQLDGAYEFQRADLESLAAGKTKHIAAISFSGYWWSDGDHYTDAPVVCSKN